MKKDEKSPRRESAQSPEPTSHQPVQGILRTDAQQSRANRVTSPRLMPMQVGPSSPQPSIDRLSVTFAIAERSCSSDGQEAASPPPVPPSPSPRPSFDFTAYQQQQQHQQQLQHQPPRRRVLTLDSTLAQPDFQRLSNIAVGNGEDDAAEEDYSISASAIIQRRNSSRRHSRRKRRPSTPFSPDPESALRRRRSSVFTTSSGDTAISMMDGEPIDATSVHEKQIFENLKLHKEVLSGVKQQPWPFNKKASLVRQAKVYVRKHEGKLQERLAQTRSTRDYLARVSLLLAKRWQYFKRELVNFKTVFVPWESRIKQIESQFGSAVASYFIFLRWLFWFNVIIATALVTFVALPELLATLHNGGVMDERKKMLPEERQQATQLGTLWEFEGVIKYSPFFYGWYSYKYSYKLPLAYFVVNLIVYIYSFVAILRKMAENSRMSKLSEKEDECVFSWKLFSGWDFMIGNAETAQNRIGSIVLGLKEALLEESEKHRDARNWKITAGRILVNLFVFAMFLMSAYVVVQIVDRSENSPEVKRNWWSQNEVSIVINLITYTFPVVFDALGMIERYHPRKHLRFQLGRIMILNLLNMYALIYALFKKINSSEERLKSLMPDSMKQNNVVCSKEFVPCAPNFVTTTTTIAVMSLVLNSSASLPKVPRDTFNLPELPFNSEAPSYQYFTGGDYLELFPGFNNNYSAPFIEDEDDIDTNYSTYTENSSSFWSSSSTDDNLVGESIESSSYEPPRVQSSITDPPDENAIVIPNDYPHLNYDHGLFDDENWTEDYSQSAEISTSSTESSSTTSTTAYEPPSVRPISPIRVETTTTRATDKYDKCEKVVECYVQVCENRSHSEDDGYRGRGASNVTLNETTMRKLKGLCWETMFGQELAKVTIVDLIYTVMSIVFVDFLRALFVRYFNKFWCWDLEKQFPQYGDFKIAENILHLVNNQGTVWMGMFFSPGLLVLNVLKLIILMYLRSWTVLTCNVPHEIVFRASRSNNFYLTLLLTMLFLCVLPVGYAITWVEPSWHCGPFSDYTKIYYLATRSLKLALPAYIKDYKILEYIASPGIVIPMIVLMTLVVYYMISLTNSLRESNNDLKIQLRKERTVERRKMFQKLEDNTPFAKWKNILPPANKSIENASIMKAVEAAVAAAEETHEPINNNKPRSSGNSENGELTEGEQDSLPHDQPPQNGEAASSSKTNERKHTWKASRTKEQKEEGSPEHQLHQSGESSGDFGGIPRIRISDEEEQKLANEDAGEAKKSEQ